MSLGRTAAATVFVDVEGDLTKFKQDLSKAGDEVKRESSRMQKAIGGAMVGAAAGIGVAAAKTFVNFEQGIKEVYTLLPDASAALRAQLAEDAKAVSGQFGQDLATVTTAMYDSISAGIPAEEVQDFLSTAGKLAIGGATDIGTAVDGLTGVINAYGAENLTAAQASDVLFGTVKAGKTTVEELASKVSAVTPIASELGISFEQVGASFAAVTAVTGNTAEASTQLRAILSELSKDGQVAAKNFEKATGKSFRTFVEEGGNVGEALLEMQGYAEENGKTLGDMFGSVEAGGAALILAKDGAGKFNESLDALTAGAGSTDAAFAEMEDSVGFRMEQMKANLTLAALTIGETLAPALGTLAELAAGFAEMLAKLPGPLSTVLVGVMGVAGALIFLAGPIGRAMQLVRAFSLLLAANPYLLLIAATVALAYVIVTNWDTIKQWVGDAAQAIDGFLTRYISDPAGDIAEIVEKLPAIFRAGWNGAKEAMRDAAEWMLNKLAELRNAADRALGPIDEIIGGAARLGGGALGFLGVPGFDDGGIVPGRTGSPQLILAHGGETILPTHKNPAAGAGGVGVSVYMTVSSEVTDPAFFERQATEISRVVSRELDRKARSAGRN